MPTIPKPKPNVNSPGVSLRPKTDGEAATNIRTTFKKRMKGFA